MKRKLMLCSFLMVFIFSVEWSYAQKGVRIVNERGSDITRGVRIAPTASTGPIIPHEKTPKTLKLTRHRSKYESGTLKEEGFYRGGGKEHIWAYFHENGKKESSGSYRLNKKQGTWKYWDENENLIKTEEWKLGVKKSKKQSTPKRDGN